MLFSSTKNALTFFILTFVISLSSIAQEGLNTNGALDINERLIETVRRGDTQAVQDLLDQGADPNAHNQSDYTALMTAVHFNYERIVRILLDAGADIDAQDTSGTTALMVACKNIIPSSYAIVSLLLEKGANLYVQNEDGNTALMIVVEDHTSDVRYFSSTDPEQALVMIANSENSELEKLKAQIDVIVLLAQEEHSSFSNIFKIQD